MDVGCTPQISAAIVTLGVVVGLVTVPAAFRRRQNAVFTELIVSLVAEGYALLSLALAAAAREALSASLSAVQALVCLGWVAGVSWSLSVRSKTAAYDLVCSVACIAVGVALAVHHVSSGDCLLVVSSALGMASSSFQALSAGILVVLLRAEARQAENALVLFPQQTVVMIQSHNYTIPKLWRRLAWAGTTRWLRDALERPGDARGAGRAKRVARPATVTTAAAATATATAVAAAGSQSFAKAHWFEARQGTRRAQALPSASESLLSASAASPASSACPAQEEHGLLHLLYYSAQERRPFSLRLGGARYRCVKCRGGLAAFWSPQLGAPSTRLAAQGPRGARGARGAGGVACGFVGGSNDPAQEAGAAGLAEAPHRSDASDRSDTNWSSTTETSLTDFNTTPLAINAILHRNLFSSRRLRPRRPQEAPPAESLSGARGGFPEAPRSPGLPDQDASGGHRQSAGSWEPSGIDDVRSESPVASGGPFDPSDPHASSRFLGVLPASSGSPGRQQPGAMFLQRPRSIGPPSSSEGGATGDASVRSARSDLSGGNRGSTGRGEASEAREPKEAGEAGDDVESADNAGASDRQPSRASKPRLRIQLDASAGGAPGGERRAKVGGQARSDHPELLELLAQPENDDSEGESGSAAASDGSESSAVSVASAISAVSAGSRRPRQSRQPKRAPGGPSPEPLPLPSLYAKDASRGLSFRVLQEESPPSELGAIELDAEDGVHVVGAGETITLPAAFETAGSAVSAGLAGAAGAAGVSIPSVARFARDSCRRSSHAGTRLSAAGPPADATLDAPEALLDSQDSPQLGFRSGPQEGRESGQREDSGAGVIFARAPKQTKPQRSVKPAKPSKPSRPSKPVRLESDGESETITAAAAPSTLRPVNPRLTRGSLMVYIPSRYSRPSDTLPPKERLSLIRYWTLRSCKRADARFLLEVHRSRVLLDVIDILLRSPARNHPYPLHVRFVNETAVDLSGLKPEVMNLLGQALFGAYEADEALNRTGAAADLDEERGGGDAGAEAGADAIGGNVGAASAAGRPSPSAPLFPRRAPASDGPATSELSPPLRALPPPLPYPSQPILGAEYVLGVSQTSNDEHLPTFTARVTADQLSRLRRLNANVIIGEANTVCPSPDVGIVVAYCMGWCIGKCLFHSISLEAQLSKMFLSLLIDVPPRISDIAEFDPGLAKLVQQAEIDDDAFATLKDSIPHLRGRWYRNVRCRVEEGPPPAAGGQASSSKASKRLRVIDSRRVVLARHYPGAAETIQSASRGFYSAIPDPASYFLDVDLLHSVVVGRPVIDVVDWKANSVVQGFPPDCLVPEWFWDILENHPRVRAEILHFACGIRAPPQEGFAALGRPLFKSEAAYPFTLRPCAAKKLPSAHTCTNTLELPLVQTRRELLIALRKSLYYGRTMDIV